MASLSVCHLDVSHWMAILLSIVTFYGTNLFEQLINIARFIEMWRVCVSAFVFASFNQLELAIHIYCHSLFHTSLNDSHFSQNCLLCKIPGNESRFFVTQN